MSISSVLKQFKSDAQLLGLSENLFLVQLVFNSQKGDSAARAKLEEMRDTAVDQDDIDFFQALIDGSIRIDDSARLHSSIADSLKDYGTYTVTVQNDDGGWEFFELVPDSTILRDRTNVSIFNQFGDSPLALMNIFTIFKDQSYMESARQTMEAVLPTVLDPFNRFVPNTTEMLCTLGAQGPLQFTDYYNKGIEAAEAEINYYKTIQHWHDKGNPPNPEPPVGNGSDGGLLDLWTNENAQCRAISLEDAAQRFTDRNQLIRTWDINLGPYDHYGRIKYCRILSAKGETIDGDDFGDFALALANNVKDQYYPSIDPSTFVWYPLNALGHCAVIAKLYESEPGFATMLSDTITQIKSFKISGSSTPEIDGLYSVDTPLGSENWFSGDKHEHGIVLQALVLAGETEAARDLATLIIENFQSPSGNYTADIFDYFLGETYTQEGNSLVAIGLFEAFKAKIL